MLAKVLEVLFVGLLVAGVPVISSASTRGEPFRLMPRPALYFSAALSEWLLAALGAGVMLVTSRSLARIGFRAVAAMTFIRWAGLLTVVSLAAMGLILLLERWGWWPAESELVYRLLPRTGAEKLWAVLLIAPTAAFAEEFLYRGYLLAVLSEWFPAFSAVGWVIASAAFGLAHVYQGPFGTLRAALVGALLAYPVLRFGSLYPSMAAHFLIDAAALGWLGPAFLRTREAGSRSAGL